MISFDLTKPVTDGQAQGGRGFWWPGEVGEEQAYRRWLPAKPPPAVGAGVESWKITKRNSI